MASFPAPAEGIALTHFVVTSDVGRSCRFYADVLGVRALPRLPVKARPIYWTAWYNWRLPWLHGR